MLKPLGRATNHGEAKNGWSLGNESFPGALRSSYSYSRSHRASIATNIVVYLIVDVMIWLG